MSYNLLYTSEEHRDKLRTLMRKIVDPDLSDEEADAANREMQIFLLSLWLRVSRTSKEVPNCLQLDINAQQKMQEHIEKLTEERTSSHTQSEV